MAYNLILDYTNVEISYVNGPITVAQAKSFCRVENTTTAQDQQFAMWVMAARTKIENYTGLSLIPRNIVAVLSVPQGQMELPFGPVTGAVSFVSQQGVAQTITTYGLNFPSIQYPVCYTKVTYTAGYADGECPEELQTAMLMQIAFWNENRGDVAPDAGFSSAQGWAPQVIAIVQKYRRNIL